MPTVAPCSGSYPKSLEAHTPPQDQRINLSLAETGVEVWGHITAEPASATMQLGGIISPHTQLCLWLHRTEPRGLSRGLTVWVWPGASSPLPYQGGTAPRVKTQAWGCPWGSQSGDSEAGERLWLVCSVGQLASSDCLPHGIRKKAQNLPASQLHFRQSRLYQDIQDFWSWLEGSQITGKDVRLPVVGHIPLGLSCTSSGDFCTLHWAELAAEIHAGGIQRVSSQIKFLRRYSATTHSFSPTPKDRPAVSQSPLAEGKMSRQIYNLDLALQPSRAGAVPLAGSLREHRLSLGSSILKHPGCAVVAVADSGQ